MCQQHLQKYKMIILRGVSGSGKSTFAHDKIKAVAPDEWEIVSRDALRLSTLGENGLKSYFEHGLDVPFEEELTRQEHLAIVKALRAGKKVVIDNTNIRHKYVLEYIKLARDLGLESHDVAILTFRVSLQTACERVKKRNQHFVPENVIQKQIDTLGKDLYPEELFAELEDSGYVPKTWHIPTFPVEPSSQNPYDELKSKPVALICDLDGTLAHRRLLTEPYPHLRSFYDYKASATDEPDFFVAAIVRAMYNSGFKILFVSGRKKEGEQATRKFIKEVFGDTDFEYELFMRDPEIDSIDDPKIKGGRRDLGDDLVKLRLFNEYIRDKYYVIGVFDDRKRVIAVWEALGLRVANMGKLNEEF